MNEELLRLWPRAEPILDAVLEAELPEQEATAVAACGGEPALERVVMALLQADRECGGFLEKPYSGLAAEASEAADASSLPQRIGPFRIVRELGRGGAGAVMLAERDDGQFAHRVAIKVLYAGVHSTTVHQGFLREREILSRLDHPNIARLYDGGVTEQGVPYYVMEFVDGHPVDEHCDHGCLTIEARLRLFREVCRAVEYAHSRLVVHRDVKPANVLVGSGGDVKLLDFGIAKLLEDAGEATQTIAGALTPVYAAPEQLSGEPVTAATDVYQLGLVLYELLTGHRPHGEPTSSFLDLRRRVLETDPLRPSRAVLEGVSRTRGDRSVTISAAQLSAFRGSSPAALARRLHGDLDAIVLKALRKEPAERYATVEALRRDLDDLLANRPVSARRGSAPYRLRKFARRHTMALTATAAVVVSLAAGLFGVATQSRVAQAERDRARMAEAKATAINEFLVNELLRAPAPEKSLGKALTVADVLDNASRSVGYAFADQREIEADLRLTLARTYAALGHPGEARTHAEAAYGLLAASGGDERQALRAKRLVAEVATDEGRYAEARAQLAALRRRQTELLGPQDPDMLETTAALGRAVTALGEASAAEGLLREALKAAETVHPEKWRLALELRRRLVEALIAEDKAMEAEAICRRMLEVQRQHLGPDHPDVATTLLWLARALNTQLRYSEAAAAYEQLVKMDEHLFGPQHPETADALMALAALYFNGLSRRDEAQKADERAFAIYRAALGPNHPKTLRARENIGILHRESGRIAEAEPIYREVLAARRRTLGETHPDTLRSLTYLNQLLAADRRLDEAREAARDVMRAYEAALVKAADPTTMERYAAFLTTADPEDVRNPRRALEVAARAVTLTQRKRLYPLRELGRAQWLTGRPDLAAATLREALELPDGVRSWSTEVLAVDVLRAQAKPEELEKFLLWRMEQWRTKRGEGEPLAAKTLRFLALHYEKQGRPQEAERHFALVLAQLRKSRPDSFWEVARAKSELGERLAGRGAYAQAEPLLLEAHATLAPELDLKPTTDTNRRRLVRLYEAWGRPEEAARWRATLPR